MISSMARGGIRISTSHTNETNETRLISTSRTKITRILNVRWRKMQGGIVHHFISILVKECTNTPLEAIALSLEDSL